MTEKLTVIEGPMFAGKTDELLRRLRRAEVINKKVQVFKPRIDDRWGKIDKIASHSGGERDAHVVESSEEILDLLEEGVDVVGISEAQFFEDEEKLIEVILKLIEDDVETIVEGLSKDFKRAPFGAMPILLALADEIESLTALCDEDIGEGVKCGEDATLTQRFVDGEPAKRSDPVIVVGAEEQYAARCYKHHKVG